LSGEIYNSLENQEDGAGAPNLSILFKKWTVPELAEGDEQNMLPLLSRPLRCAKRRRKEIGIY